MRKKVTVLIEKIDDIVYCNYDGPYPMVVKGCPMGRGNTEASAIKDFIYRVKIENGFEANIVKINYRCFDMEADANVGGEDDCPQGMENEYNLGF